MKTYTITINGYDFKLRGYNKLEATCNLLEIIPKSIYDEISRFIAYKYNMNTITYIRNNCKLMKGETCKK